MKKNLLLLVLLVVSSISALAGGETTTQIGYIPTSHPDGCVAIQLRNLDSVGTHTWNFNPAVVNATTGPPAVTSITCAGGSEPVVYWTAPPAGQQLNICYDGDCEDFHSCNCNPMPADDIGDAPLVCNSYLYCGTTSSAYGVDHETTVDPVHTGSLENNSWLQFIADSTDVTFTIDVAGTCEMQFAVYAYSGGTTSFEIFTDLVWTSTTGFSGYNVINATGLTAGTQYYIHLDGDGGQECDYQVSFQSGIQQLDVSGSAATVCPGNPATLTVTPSDPSASYVWTSSPPGGPYPNAFAITVNPTVNTNYFVTVTGGSCSVNDTLTIPVTIDPGCVLPVEFAMFSGECKGNYTQLKWQTLSEINNDYFTIWESSDGVNFTEIGGVPGAGNSNEPNEYSWAYKVNTPGTKYYKLSQTDFDGSIEFTNTISVANCKIDDSSIFVDNANTIRIQGSNINSVRIFNTVGQEITSSINPNNLNEIKVSNIQSGIYIVSVNSNNYWTNKKVIVK